MASAVDMVANSTAPREIQSEKGATYDAMLNKAELQDVRAKNLFFDSQILIFSEID